MPRDSYVPRLDGADGSLSPVLLIEVSLSVYLSVYVSVYVRVHVAATCGVEQITEDTPGQGGLSAMQPPTCRVA